MEMVQAIRNIWTLNRGFDKCIYLYKGLIWAIRKRMGHIFWLKLTSGFLIKIYPDSSYSGLFYFRSPEWQEIEFFKENSFLSDTFVDIGANVGIYSGGHSG